MKTQITLLAVLLIVSVSFSALTYVGDGIYHMDSFYDLGDFSTSQTLRMDVGNNLLIDFGDGPLSVIEADYYSGRWHLGLVDDEGYIIGWAYNGAKQVPGREGRLVGAYSYELGEGNKPSGAYLVYDALDNGFHVDTGSGIGVLGVAQDLLEGDLFFTEQDIFFNGVLGDLSQLPTYNYGYVSILPEMTLLIPEPMTLALIGLGGIMISRRRRVR